MAPDCTFSQEHIELLGIISEGRMFRIHKARRGTKYIILKSAVHKDAMTTEFLRREYELGNTLSHSSIVTTLGFEEDTPAGPALILEYVEGQSLDEFLSAGPSDSAKDCIIDDILDGVDYLHHRGVLHNDIKPSNIVVNPHGAARIIDFGLSISDDSVYKGCMGGSPGYSAPEIMAGKGPAGAASDIYSIGLLIRQMSGRKYRRIIDRCGSHIRSVCADHDSSLKSGNCRHRVIPQCSQRPPEDRNVGFLHPGPRLHVLPADLL